MTKLPFSLDPNLRDFPPVAWYVDSRELAESTRFGGEIRIPLERFFREFAQRGYPPREQDWRDLAQRVDKRAAELDQVIKDGGVLPAGHPSGRLYVDANEHHLSISAIKHCCDMIIARRYWEKPYFYEAIQIYNAGWICKHPRAVNLVAFKTWCGSHDVRYVEDWVSQDSREINPCYPSMTSRYPSMYWQLFAEGVSNGRHWLRQRGEWESLVADGEVVPTS